jgi:hypothetical protein
MMVSAVYEAMVMSSGSDQWVAEFENYVEPPNEIDPDTGMPLWYGSDEEAWGTFLVALNG